MASKLPLGIEVKNDLSHFKRWIFWVWSRTDKIPNNP